MSMQYRDYRGSMLIPQSLPHALFHRMRIGQVQPVIKANKAWSLFKTSNCALLKGIHKGRKNFWYVLEESLVYYKNSYFKVSFYEILSFKPQQI